MIVKWIQSMGRAAEAQAAKQGDEEDRKLRHETKLVDVAHKAMVERAAEDRATLEALVRMGWPHVQREKFKWKVRKKVWDAVGEEVAAIAPDLVEEVTERITDVAEGDDYYREMFDEEEA